MMVCEKAECGLIWTLGVRCCDFLVSGFLCSMGISYHLCCLVIPLGYVVVRILRVHGMASAGSTSPSLNGGQDIAHFLPAYRWRMLRPIVPVKKWCLVHANNIYEQG